MVNIYIYILFLAAILPIIALGFFIYAKDVNKEPSSLLAKIFFLGFFSAIPVVIVELAVDALFPTEGVSDFIIIFVNTFFSVALIEEGFKWLVTKKFGYNNKEFDEIYDVIVYAVFASLGFACIENLLYVFSTGFKTAIVRAIFSVPGHACFAIVMGYFLSKAKVNNINGSKDLEKKNLLLSVLIPSLAHTAFDAILFYLAGRIVGSFLVLFFVFYGFLVGICFGIVGKISKLQQNLNTNFATGVLSADSNGNIQFHSVSSTIKYCPVCGRAVQGYHFCPSCGFHID